MGVLGEILRRPRKVAISKTAVQPNIRRPYDDFEELDDNSENREMIAGASGHDYFIRTVMCANMEAQYDRRAAWPLHVSNVIQGICPRAVWLARKFNLNPVTVLSPAVYGIFSVGRAVEKHIREQFMRIHGKENIYASWSCKCGETRRTDTGWDSQLCKVCKTPINSVYHEVDVRLCGGAATGHPDIVFLDEAKQFHVVEIKSISKKAYMELDAPMDKHIEQVSAYYVGLKEAGNLMADKCDIVYMSKEATGRGYPAYKQFSIAGDDAIEVGNKLCDDIEESANQILGESIPRRMCDEATCTTAKKCFACCHCFNLHNPEDGEQI